MGYLPGVLHMKNIRELRFSVNSMDAAHWNAITTLESLEELSFNEYEFLQGPADVEPRGEDQGQGVSPSSESLQRESPTHRGHTSTIPTHSCRRFLR